MPKGDCQFAPSLRKIKANQNGILYFFFSSMQSTSMSPLSFL